MTISIHDQPPADYVKIVDTGLDQANQLALPEPDIRPLATFAHSAANEIIGGALGRTWGQCCELQELWVHSDYRLQGIATGLMQAFEQRAQQRGCTVFYLETFSFQAEGFYRKLGYEAKLIIYGYAEGITKHLMLKDYSKG